MLIDTHCHLNHADFDADREVVIARAGHAGVQAMVVIGYDLPSSERAVSLAEREPSLFSAVGVHPHDARSLNDAALAQLAALTAHPKVVALGEIGLDFYRNLSPRADQESAFRRQIALARRLRLPIILHTRESEEEVLTILEEEGTGGLPGILHCFSAGPAIAERCFRLGFHVGLGGVLTFKNAQDLQQTAAGLPLDRIVLETDAPYLAPHPHRGRRNEPAYVALVAGRLAELHDRDPAEIAEITTANAHAVFGPRLSAGTAAARTVSKEQSDNDRSVGWTLKE
jgi:TatD DNase family protein